MSSITFIERFHKASINEIELIVGQQMVLLQYQRYSVTVLLLQIKNSLPT